MTGWQLTTAAAADLDDILRFTLNQWGDNQARRFAADLKAAMQALADHPHRHRAMPRLHTDLRIARCRQHLIFALPQADGPTLILAILHERMDLMARLAHRLP